MANQRSYLGFDIYTFGEKNGVVALRCRPRATGAVSPGRERLKAPRMKTGSQRMKPSQAEMRNERQKLLIQHILLFFQIREPNKLLFST